LTVKVGNVSNSFKDEVKNLRIELEEKNILAFLKQKNRIVPDFTSENLYPSLEILFRFYNKDEIQKILDSLAEKGSLNRKINKILLSCPNCSSINLLTSIECECGKKEMEIIQLMEHQSCRSLSISWEDDQKKGVFCSKCRSFISDLNSLKTLRILYKCNNCEDVKTSPLLNYICRDCSTVFNKEEIKIKKFFEYCIPSTQENNLIRQDTLNEIEIIPDSEIIQEIFLEKETDTLRSLILPESYLLILTSQKTGFDNIIEMMEKIKQKRIHVTYIDSIKQMKKQLTRNFNLILIEHNPEKFEISTILEEINIWGIETPLIVFGENIEKPENIMEEGIIGIINKDGVGLELLSHYI
jgi:hypothetical protein